MAEKRGYRIVDCLTSVDIRENKVVPGARTRVGGSHDGKQDLGHVCKSIFEYDDFGLLWVVQEAGVSSPYNDYVYHPDADEIEYVIAGTCDFSCPGIPSFKLKSGDFMCPLDSIPHENTHEGLDCLNLLVFYPRQISEVGRVEFKKGDPYDGPGTCPVVHCYDTPAEEIAPGHFRLICCNAKTISASYQYLAPGTSVPEKDFIVHDKGEIVFILEGSGIATYPDKTYQLRPHLAIYNPAGTPHKIWNNTDKDLRMLVLYTTGNVTDVKTDKKAFSVD